MKHQLRDGSEVVYTPCFLSPAASAALQTHLAEAIAWENPRGWRRSVAYMADEPRMVYAYSRVRLDPSEWTAPLAELRDRVRGELGLPINSVLLNRYDTGDVAVGAHRDDEACYRPDHVVASLSLGASRRFCLSSSGRGGAELTLELEDGSALTFPGKLTHWVPPAAGAGPRFNLTFRSWSPPSGDS